MELVLQVIVLAIAVTLSVQRSAGSNISPSPSIFDAIPPIERIPVISIDVNATSPASQPNVSHLPPVLPPVNFAPAPEMGTRNETAPSSSPNTPPPSSGHELVPPPSANAPPPLSEQELVPPPSANIPPPLSGHEPVRPPSADTPPPLSGHEIVPPPLVNTPPPLPDHESVSPPSGHEPVPPPSENTPSFPGHEIVPPPSANTPPLPGHELVPPPSADAPHNQNPIKNSPKPVPIAPVSVTTPTPSSSPRKSPSVNPVVPRTDPPSSAPNIAPTNKAPPLKPHARVHPPQKHNDSRHGSSVAPLSSPESPPVLRPQAPASLPSTSTHHGKENITTSPLSSLQLPSPSPIEKAPSPKSHANSGQKGHAAPPSPSPFPKDEVLPDSSPSPTPPGQTSLTILSPKTSPSGPSPSHTERPLLPPIHALPPPPPNEDCSSFTCVEPYTNTPPGSPCGCVWPMQVGLRLGVALYTFFPLVSELAEEISIGVFMRQSQVRIMGANAASQDPEKTIVLVNLVPLGKKFDNTTAYLTADRFWNKQVWIHSSLFGNYEVLYVRYPGLPPSPPSSVGVMNGEPYIGQGGNGRSVKPVGVDVSAVHHKKKGLSGSVVAIIVLSASVVLIMSVAVFWVVLSKSRHCQQGSNPPLATFLSKTSDVAAHILGTAPSSESLSIISSMAPYTGSAKTFSSSDIEKATDSFNDTRVLGEGGFGRVYSGVLEDGTKLAVKVLKRDDQQGGREFLAEVEMLSRLHHRNLVKLIGICTEDRARCLVYELIPNGSVESHLHGVDKEIAPLDWGSRLKIALGAARALAYLHEDSSPRVIHRDFKSSNILLEDDFTPKVSDFGLARTALEEENKHISTRVMGTFGYVAPEYAMTGHLLVKSDVYSYGVVLLELLTGRKPVDMSQPPGQENLVTWARPRLTNQEDLESIIDSSLGPDFPFSSIAKVSAIASMCVQPEVSHRPFMGEVVQALKLVCDECDIARELESRSCSLESSSSSNIDPLDMHSPVSNFNCGLDVESGLSGSTPDIFRFKRLEKQDSGSFRRHSSSGPLTTGRSDRVWRKLRRLSGGTVSEHRTNFRFWSGSH